MIFLNFFNMQEIWRLHPYRHSPFRLLIWHAFYVELEIFRTALCFQKISWCSFKFIFFEQWIQGKCFYHSIVGTNWNPFLIVIFQSGYSKILHFNGSRTSVPSALYEEEDAVLSWSKYSLDLDRISGTVDALRPSTLLMLALLWPLSNCLMMSSFVSRIITLCFFSSDSTDITFPFGHEELL
jgi:hypothetical protein